MEKALFLAAVAWLCVRATPAGAATRALPTGFASSIDAADRPLTSIVVADIDADGDADVVATDEALNLFVWINDGTGRLTRQRPSPARPASTDGERPGVERGIPAPAPSVPSDPSAVDTASCCDDAALLVWSGIARAGAVAHDSGPHSAHGLRGPPAPAPLF